MMMNGVKALLELRRSASEMQRLLDAVHSHQVRRRFSSILSAAETFPPEHLQLIVHFRHLICMFYETHTQHKVETE